MRARGQAMVEAALGSTVFVTILIFGIHFAEVGYASLGVHDASRAALFDVTGMPMHDLTTGDMAGPKTASVARAAQEATGAHGDLDAYASGKGATFTQVFTQVTGVTVTCAIDRSVAAFPQDYSVIFEETDAAVRCTAEALAVPFGIPSSFLDAEGGLFRAPHWMGASQYRLCAFGRAQNNECPGHAAMLIDDWGLQGTAEQAERGLYETGRDGNAAFATLVQKIFDQHIPRDTVASKMAAELTGESPLDFDENHFWFAFRGEESSFKDPDYPDGEGPDDWVVSPGTGSRMATYASAHATRQEGWLGLGAQWRPR